MLQVSKVKEGRYNNSSFAGRGGHVFHLFTELDMKELEVDWNADSLKEAVSLMLYGLLKQVIFPQHLHKHHNNWPLLSLFLSLSNSENISFSGQTGELLHRLRLRAWQAVCTLQISGTSVCDVPGCYCISVWPLRTKRDRLGGNHLSAGRLKSSDRSCSPGRRRRRRNNSPVATYIFILI